MILLIFFFFTSKPDTLIANGEDTTSSEEEKEDQNINVHVMHQVTDSVASSSCYKDVTHSELFSGQMNGIHSVNGSNPYHSNEDEEEEEEEDGGDNENENDHDALGVGDYSIPTIYFSHTVEPKRVCILLTINFACNLNIQYHL